MRIRQKTQLVTVEFPNVAFVAFVNFTTLGSTIFNFQKPKKLRRIYPLSVSDAVINMFGRLELLDLNGNPLQAVPVTSASGVGAVPTLKIDSRVGFNEFINLEIGGFSIPSIAVEVAGPLTFQITFEFEEEYIDDSF